MQFIQKNTFLIRNKKLLIGSILLGLVLIFGIGYRKKTKIELNSTSGNTIQIRKYVFYYEKHGLEFDGSKIPLTVKESKLLYVLFTSPNVIIDRNVLQKEVWENDGVIVTRSLDMFISKLRKKLNKDSAVSIVNIHGVGYKLEVL